MSILAGVAAAGGGLLTGDLLYWNDSDHFGAKSKRWSVKPEVQTFIDSNKGKIAMIDDMPYLITGEIKQDVNERNNQAKVVLYSLNDKKTVEMTGR